MVFTVCELDVVLLPFSEWLLRLRERAAICSVQQRQQRQRRQEQWQGCVLLRTSVLDKECNARTFLFAMLCMQRVWMQEELLRMRRCEERNERWW